MVRLFESQGGFMGWKMENRDGAAIRHVIHKMSTWFNNNGFYSIVGWETLDCGDKFYFDDYAKPTQAALVEAIENGNPILYHVDPYGHEYLTYMYGPHGFVTIQNMRNFSQQLAKVYAAMTL